MLNENDMVWLIRQIIGTAELLGQEIKPTAADMLADDLSSYPRPVLAAALSRVRTEHTGRLTPKAIIDRIDEAMGRPGANEAWAVAVTAMDENNTVVWTDEMAQAWGMAQSIAGGGDMVGARMAFISAYERLVRTAREERRMPSVTVSVGWDADGRTAAVEKAVQLGYMPADQAQQYLPAPAAAPGFNAVALLTGRMEPAAEAPPEIRERLAQLREELAEGDRRRARERAARIAADAADLAERKARAQRLVDEKLKTKQDAHA
ncbi:MAG: hypothetical protein PHU77_00245 [Simplicispira sp.]|nr:hypothetical protein [Simplicispira sp.]